MFSDLGGHVNQFYKNLALWLVISLLYRNKWELSGLVQQKSLENFTFDQSTGSVTLQPGKYQISFRAKNAKGSKFTVTKEFEITPRQITNISIYN